MLDNYNLKWANGLYKLWNKTEIAVNKSTFD